MDATPSIFWPLFRSWLRGHKSGCAIRILRRYDAGFGGDFRCERWSCTGLLRPEREPRAPFTLVENVAGQASRAGTVTTSSMAAAAMITIYGGGGDDNLYGGSGNDSPDRRTWERHSEGRCRHGHCFPMPLRPARRAGCIMQMARGRSPARRARILSQTSSFLSFNGVQLALTNGGGANDGQRLLPISTVIFGATFFGVTTQDWWLPGS